MMSPKKIAITGRFGLLLGIVVLLTALCTCASLQGAGLYGNLGGASDTVPLMEKVRTGTLSSGLRYYILENARPENRAYLTLAVNAGSVLEEDDERGLAHFVEHMAFNGTARFPEAQLIDYLRSLGMRFGPEVNAYTSFDETVYGIEVPVETVDGKRNIPATALAVLDDWTRAITFASADVDDERKVIMEEYRSRLGAWERIRQKMLPVLFSGSPYAERLPIGLPEIIEGAPASRLEGFYRKWYQADNMALIFVGDFDGAVLEASLGDHFAIADNSSPVQRPQYDLPPPQKGNIETLIVTDAELTAVNINLYYKREREPIRGDLSYFREEIVNILIGRMLDYHFMEEALKSETPYTYADAGEARYGASSRFYVLTAEAKTGAAGDCLAALLKTRTALLRYGFTKAELAMASESLMSDMRQMVSEKDRQESERYVRLLTRYYREGGNLADAAWELEALEQLLPRISVKDINAAVKDYFNPGDLRVLVFAPEAERANLPTEAQIRQIVKESALAKVVRPKTKTAVGGLVSRPPVPGTIVSESVDDETGALVWVLSNGVTMILKETRNRNNEIIVKAMARGGTSSARPDEWVSAKLAAEMAQISGLGPHSRTELTKKLIGKQVSFSFWISGYYRGFDGSASAGDLAALFEMIYLGITDPRIDPKMVKVMMDQYRTQLALRNENPDTVFSDELSRTIYGGHPFFRPLELSDIPGANIETARTFLRRCLNPGDYTCVLAGNLDIPAIRVLAETWLAAIPPSESLNEWTSLQFERPGKAEKTVYKGKEDRSLVYLGWFSKALYSEELSAAAQVLNEYLEIKMTEDIREKLGGVYSISAGVSAMPVPGGEIAMQIYFACDPKRVGELSDAVINLLRLTAANSPAGGIDQDTFDKSVEALKKEWETSMQSNSYIAQSYANSSVLLKLPLSRLDKRPGYFSAVTPAGIQDICARLLQDGPAQVVLYPEQR
ncbi:MAG: insulinase family protein [Treponema sp.]|nr:insulinase family protein [Treponema sp.]